MEETAAADPVATPGVAPPPDTPQPDTLADIVERWWNEHFPGSPVAQVTAVWNHAFAAKEALKRQLADFIGGGR